MQIRPTLLSKRLLTLAVTLATSGAARAQEVQIECLSFPKHAVETIELLVGKEETIPVTLQSHALTTPLKVPRSATWQFGKSTTDKEGKFRFKTFGAIKPLGASKQLLLFIREGPAVADGLKVVALDAGKTGFGASKMMLMNLADRPVAGQVGGQRFVLAPRKHVVIKPAADRGKNLCFADLRYQRDGKWRAFFSTNWPVLPDARGLIFIYNDPRSVSLKIHSVVDSLRPVPEQR